MAAVPPAAGSDCISSSRGRHWSAPKSRLLRGLIVTEITHIVAVRLDEWLTVNRSSGDVSSIDWQPPTLASLASRDFKLARPIATCIAPLYNTLTGRAIFAQSSRSPAGDGGRWGSEGLRLPVEISSSIQATIPFLLSRCGYCCCCCCRRCNCCCDCCYSF